MIFITEFFKMFRQLPFFSKKIFFCFSFVITTFFLAFAQELPQNFHEYTLENGLKVFVLEDFSSAPVRIELSVKAGFSAQTPKTAGFFPLYVRLFTQTQNKSTSSSVKSSGDCYADSARFITIVAPIEAEKVIEHLSINIFSPSFSDDLIKKEFAELKTSVIQNAFSTAGFINSSIDSRIFADKPWKQDSGIYPSIFTNTPIEEARTILTNIGKNYYTPQNCALFISGGITTDDALNFVRKYFQNWTSSAAGILSDSSEKITPSPQKKFVLHDPLFTPEMSQIVVQYTKLSMHEADVIGAVLNAYNSSLKTELTEHKELAIRGQDYINAAAAHKNGSSRLIIQSLLEKTNKSPVTQAETFIKIVQESAEKCKTNDFDVAKEILISQYQTQFKNSQAFMDLLSQFWAISDISKMHTENVSTELLQQPEIILAQDDQLLLENYKNEIPFVFVLVNSNTFKKNEKSFKNAGYEEVTTKNGSWFSQKLYSALKNQLEEKNKTIETELSQNVDTQAVATERFAKANKNQFESFRLSNNIPVVVKRNLNATTAVISLAISGGKLSSAQTNPGLAEVMTNALAQNIQKDISQSIYYRKIKGDPEVLAETKMSGGIITVECLSDDVLECLSCISNAIIYGNIKPAEADGIIYDRRSQHRIQIGSTEYQLYAQAIELLYPNTNYPLVYNKNAEILSNTEYTEILAAYPSLLDAAKYSLVLTGNVPNEKLKDLLENSFGVLFNQTQNQNRLYTQFPAPNFEPFLENKKKGRQVIKLEHQFFTDLSSDKAGPRPEILIPTTDFSDPVQYWIPSPAQNSSDFYIFNAILYELEEQIQNALQNNKETKTTSVKITPANAEIQAAVITFLQVQHTKKIDELYAEVIHNAFDPEQDISIVEKIKNRWIMKNLLQTQTNRGTALLIREGLEQGDIEGTTETEFDTSLSAAQRYISEYEQLSKLKAGDFLRVAKKYFAEIAPLRLYSKDSKD